MTRQTMSQLLAAAGGTRRSPLLSGRPDAQVRNAVLLASMLICGSAQSVSAQSGPSWTEVHAPRRLSIRMEKLPGPGIAARAPDQADFRVPRAGRMTIDTEFTDWTGAQWIAMHGAPYLFGDNFELLLDIELPADYNPEQTPDPHSYFGITYDQVDPDLIDRYDLDEIYDARGAVVISVKPGSPAAKAGVREGDVVLKLGDHPIKWCYELHREIGRALQQKGPQTIPVRVKRNGRENLGPPEDLSARFAFMVDDEMLYFAALVTDDVHAQTRPRADIWQNDCIQIGFDPTLYRYDAGYGEDGHEIGFALKDDRPAFYRWHGRRGQDDRIDGLELAVKREGTQTLYEAAIPLLSLAPLSPDMWPHCGINVVVGDSDDGLTRKQHLSLSKEVMTTGKQLHRFADFKFDPSPDKSRISVAWFWDYRLHPSGKFGLKVCLFSPTPTRIRLAARLEDKTENKYEPSRAEVEIPVTDQPAEWMLRMTSRTQPGEYRIEWVAYNETDKPIAHEGLPIIIRW